MSAGVGNRVLVILMKMLKMNSGEDSKTPKCTQSFHNECNSKRILQRILSDTLRINLPKNYLIGIIEAKIRALSDFEDLDKISEEYKFNFREIKDLWDSLPNVEFRDDSDIEIKQKGTSSKTAIINETVIFMKKHRLVDEHNNAVYPTERFKAIVSEAYNRSDVQTDIIEFIDDLTCLEEEKNAET